MDQAQNTFSALQTLAFQAKFTVRWFVLGADPDQASNSPTIGLGNQAVKHMPSTLGASVLGSDNFGGGKPHSGRTSGKVSARFRFNYRGAE
jgi:hypothetical protein